MRKSGNTTVQVKMLLATKNNRHYVYHKIMLYKFINFKSPVKGRLSHSTMHDSFVSCWTKNRVIFDMQKNVYNIRLLLTQKYVLVADFIKRHRNKPIELPKIQVVVHKGVKLKAYYCTVWNNITAIQISNWSWHDHQWSMDRARTKEYGYFILVLHGITCTRSRSYAWF